MSHTDTWRSLIMSDDATRLAAKVERDLGRIVDAARFHAVCRASFYPMLGHHPDHPDDEPKSWSEASWDSWIRNRIAEVGASGHTGNPRQREIPDLVIGVFHLGFVAIEETAEHMERLRAGWGPNPDPRPARSKVSRTNDVIRPIDGVAARVGPIRMWRPPHNFRYGPLLELKAKLNEAP